MAPSRTDRLFPPPEAPPPAAAVAWTLPHDLVLEIVARSDFATVVRSAATCKPLRRDIFSPAFIRRVCRQHGGPNGAVVPRFLVGYLGVHNNAGEKRAASFSLVHPATPAATSFSEDQVAPLLSRRAADLSRRYMPLTSRNGLAVLRRGAWGICVYDPMSGRRAYLSRPQELWWQWHTFVLLTAADGIGCPDGTGWPFILLATDSSVSRIQTQASSGIYLRPWGPVIGVAAPDRHRGDRGYINAYPHSCAVVLDGLIHWLMCVSYGSLPSFYILTYDVPRHGTPAATTAGSIEVPKACLPESCEKTEIHLTTSPDGRLSLLVADRFTISVWLLSGSSDWARRSVIDTETIVRSHGELPQSNWPSKVDLRSSAGLRSGVVLLRP